MEIRSYDLEVNPVDLLQALADQRGCFLLESSLFDKDRGRYSHLGFDPFLTVCGDDLKAFAGLEKSFQRFYDASKKLQTPFSSGIAGYLSYDFGLQFEQVIKSPLKSNLPGFLFGFYDCVICVDHLKNKVWITSSGLPETTGLLRKKRALKRLKYAQNILKNLPKPNPSQRLGPAKHLKWKSNFSQVGYCNAVQKALNYIKAGDIYQVNLAQKFSCELKQPIDAVNVYRTLRVLSASCFGGYFDCGPSQIVSSSPEIFLRLQKGIVQTRPMKGTRKRGKTPQEDKRQCRELRQSAKEKAELLMVTDLERNDLGRVCDFGSVIVKQLREIEKYRTVYQTTSTVTGKLTKGKNGFDLLKNCFPSGSVSGCPKIRAMQLIKKLEPVPRGIYTGALGYMNFNGDMALNVLIRSVVIKGKKASFHVGSGIVADSLPQAEYEETLVKARALKESLEYENAHHFFRRPV